LFSVYSELIPIVILSVDFSVLWLFCLHNILPKNSSIFQHLQCSFFIRCGQEKSYTIFVSVFFYSILVNILAETASVNLNSFVVVMYIYILSMVSAVCPFKSYISSWVLFFQLPAFVEFLKDKPVKLYIRVFIIYPVHT